MFLPMNLSFVPLLRIFHDTSEDTPYSDAGGSYTAMENKDPHVYIVG
jgi:nitrite reductase/ring-hydroxylating ferredoxin subunit